jgi:putative membrane protein
MAYNKKQYMRDGMTIKKNYTKLIWGLSIGINFLICLAYFVPTMALPPDYDFSYIPKLNATLNMMTFLSLLSALIAIKCKKIKLHRNFIFAALMFTGVFLGSYLLYHFTTPSTKFGGAGAIKVLYLFILLTHIVLAALIVPLAMVAIARAINRDFEKHKQIAKWVMPIWLYVSLTGVVIYLMISPYYK